MTSQTEWIRPSSIWLMELNLQILQKLNDYGRWPCNILMNRQLYKRSFSPSLVKCLRPTDADYALLEVHEEIYENHLGDKSLAYKVLRQRYYWPTMKKNTAELVQRSELCHKYTNIQHQPASWYQLLHHSPSHNGESTNLILPLRHLIKKIYSDCHWLFNQMGGSWILDTNHWK